MLPADEKTCFCKIQLAAKALLTMCYCIRCCIKEQNSQYTGSSWIFFWNFQIALYTFLFGAVLLTAPFAQERGFFMQKNKYSKLTVIVSVALLVTINVILTRFLSISTTFLRIGFGFLPVAIASIAFGPFWGAVCGAIGDILGMIIYPSGEYFPGFTITAIFTGIVFGAFLYKKYSLLKTILASATVCIFLNLFLDTLWLNIMYGEAFISLLPARFIKCIINIPIYSVLIHITWFKTLSKLEFFR